MDVAAFDGAAFDGAPVVVVESPRAVPTVLEAEWEDLEPDPGWALWEDA